MPKLSPPCAQASPLCIQTVQRTVVRLPETTEKRTPAEIYCHVKVRKQGSRNAVTSGALFQELLPVVVIYQANQMGFPCLCATFLECCKCFEAACAYAALQARYAAGTKEILRRTFENIPLNPTDVIVQVRAACMHLCARARVFLVIFTCDIV